MWREPVSENTAPVVRRSLAANGRQNMINQFQLAWLVCTRPRAAVPIIRIIFAIALFILPARADTPADIAATANARIMTGHVVDGLQQLASEFSRLNPADDPEAYWLIGSALIEYLSETENEGVAQDVISKLVQSKIPERDQVKRAWMQFYLGRHLAYSGRATDGEKFLRALTNGDSKLVHIPAQRAAATVLTRIELDRNNIAQAAIWIRRAVIGALVDKGSGTEEIVDVLTEYATFLRRTRRITEATQLFAKLAPIYDSQFAHLGPKYSKYVSEYIEASSALGNFAGADHLLQVLHEIAGKVDVLPDSVRRQIFFQELYANARSTLTGKSASVIERLKEIDISYPDFLKSPNNRVIFSYFALFTGDLDAAEKYLSDRGGTPDIQISSYERILRSLIAARREQFNTSIELVRQALDGIRTFHHQFVRESADRLPAITQEERLALGAVLALDAPHASSPTEMDTIFLLQQFLNKEKEKLGTSQRISRQILKLDLQKEEVRSRHRLMDLRDRLMDEGANLLLARTLPVRPYSISRDNDYSYLTRLEDIEDRITDAGDRLSSTITDFDLGASDKLISLGDVQKLLKPNEALVVQTIITGLGVVVTSCITSDDWMTGFPRRTPLELQQLLADEKLLISAVHGTYSPSPVLDSSFPADGAYRIYRYLFGEQDACISNRFLLLATDPDLFVIPWNALITAQPNENNQFSFRSAAWFPRLHPFSLLPSVRSLYDLRSREKLSGRAV